MLGIPLALFTGKLDISSLQVGTILLKAQPVPAVRINLHQMDAYPLVAHGKLAGEIYAYCKAAIQQPDTSNRHLEVYAPCHLVRDAQSGQLSALVQNIIWYTSEDLRSKAAESLLDVLSGRGGESFQFCNEPFLRIEINMNKR
jgi:hypothetical protein